MGIPYIDIDGYVRVLEWKWSAYGYTERHNQLGAPVPFFLFPTFEGDRLKLTRCYLMITSKQYHLEFPVGFYLGVCFSFVRPLRNVEAVLYTTGGDIQKLDRFNTLVTFSGPCHLFTIDLYPSTAANEQFVLRAQCELASSKQFNVDIVFRVQTT